VIASLVVAHLSNLRLVVGNIYICHRVLFHVSSVHSAAVRLDCYELNRIWIGSTYDTVLRLIKLSAYSDDVVFFKIFYVNSFV